MSRPALPSRPVCLGLALALALLTALGGRPSAASEPTFQALQTDGRTVTGRLKAIGPACELTVATADGKDETLPAARVVKLSREGAVPPITPEASAVLFPDGDRLYRTAVGAANETHLAVQSYSLGKLSVPLDSLLGLVLALPTDSQALEALIARVRDEPRTAEVLWLANGDRLEGGFLALTDQAVELRVNGKPVKLDRVGVGAVGFVADQAAYPRPEPPFLELTLYDGSRVGVSGATIEDGHVAATTRFGASVRVPLGELVRAHVRSPAVVYLTDRKPAAEKYVPYLGTPRPFRRDANVEGQTFRLSGQDYDRGLGTESRTLLAYRVEPGDRRFQALVGLDDRAGPLGNVVFRVLVDNKEVFASPPMSARDAPRAIDVPLEGGKVLVLATEFGQRGSVRDLADWVEARVIR